MKHDFAEALGPGQPVRKLRARKRPKGAPAGARSCPLRPDPAQSRVIRTRFFTGARAYNAVLGEFISTQSRGQIR